MNNHQQVILLDIGNVIILADHKITHDILQQKYGIPIERAKKFFDNEDYKNFSRGKINTIEFYKKLVSEHLQTDLTYGEILDAHDRHMYTVDNGVLEILKEIISKRSVAFATNTNSWQTIRENQLVDLSRYSKKIFRSNIIGMLKTDDGFFPHVLTKLSRKPEEVILIDDNSANIEKAQQSGLSTQLYTSPEDLYRFV